MRYIMKYFLSIGLSVCLISACTNNAAENKAPAETAAVEAAAGAPDEITLTSDQYTMSGIETGKIEMRNLSSIIKVNGVVDVEPSSIVNISAPLGGYVKSAGLLPGQAIKKGQVMATLENPAFIELQQDYLESKSRLEFLEQEYARQQQLREEDVNAAKTFQQVTSDYQSMKARVSALEAKMSLAGISRPSLGAAKISGTAHLYAPISGYVKTSNVDIGKYVNPTDVLFELTNTDDLHLALNVFEKDIDQVEVGQTVRFALSNETAYNRTAEVFLIGQATGKNRMIPVHCHLPDSSSSGLLPGKYVKAWISTANDSLPALPTEAVVQSEGKDYIFIQTSQSGQGYTFKMVPVKKGIQEGGLTAVSLPGNVPADEAKIVTKGAYTVLSALINSGEEE